MRNTPQQLAFQSTAREGLGSPEEAVARADAAVHAKALAAVARARAGGEARRRRLRRRAELALPVDRLAVAVRGVDCDNDR